MIIDVEMPHQLYCTAPHQRYNIILGIMLILYLTLTILTLLTLTRTLASDAIALYCAVSAVDAVTYDQKTTRSAYTAGKDSDILDHLYVCVIR